MKASTVLKAFAASLYETIPSTQFAALDSASDLSRIFGEGGKIYALGCNGIQKGLYMFFYLDEEEQSDLLETLKETAAKEGEPTTIIEALGVDVCGQTVAVVNVSE